MTRCKKRPKRVQICMQHMLGLCGSHFLKIAWSRQKVTKVTKSQNMTIGLSLFFSVWCCLSTAVVVLHTQQKLASMRWGSSVLLLLAVAS